MSTADPLDARIRRAGEPMVVEEIAPAMYEVTTLAGDTHTVDVQLGVCSCPDYEYGDALACKHHIRVFAEHVAMEVHIPLPDFEDYGHDAVGVL